MCRWAAYRGEPLYLEELVSSPAHSLIEQSHCATRAKTATNGDGFGIAWYGERPGARPLPRHPAGLVRLQPEEHGAADPLAAVPRPCPRRHRRRHAARQLPSLRLTAVWSFMHNGQIDRLWRGSAPSSMEPMLHEPLSTPNRTGTTDSELLFLLALRRRPARSIRCEAIAETIAFVELTGRGICRRSQCQLPSVKFTARFLRWPQPSHAIRYASHRPARPRRSMHAPMSRNGLPASSPSPSNDDTDDLGRDPRRTAPWCSARTASTSASFRPPSPGD
jgi:predicted glutamine amidotransferase